MSSFDDQGNKIIDSSVPLKNSKEELLCILDHHISHYKSLPENALRAPVSHYDLLPILYLIQSILS
jgi:hypothetical protein